MPDPAVQDPADPKRRRVQVGLQLDIEGHINPEIFLPQWFGREGLLRDGEVSEGTSSLEQDEGYVFFRTQDLALEATTERLRLYSVHQGLQLTYRDLVLNIFRLLRHTPLTWLRIIRSEHLAPIYILNRSVPPDSGDPIAWARLVNLNAWPEILNNPAMKSISIEGSGPGASLTTLTIEPSYLEDAVIFVASSYSYDLSPPPEYTDRTSSDILIVTLKDEWDRAVEHSEKLFDQVGDALLIPGTQGEST